MRHILPALVAGFLAVPTASSSPPDSLGIFRRTQLGSTPAGVLPATVLRNPAATWFRQDFALTSLSVGYDNDRRGSAGLSQGGDRYSGFGFAAGSFVPTSSRGRAFGSAGYSNGTCHGVQWNETSDFALLYPYLTADSVGGDLQTETYRFSGGYAHTSGAWTWAALLAYRAVLEYREVDPRPRNVVSDLDGSLAAARAVGPDYRLSLALRGRKYSQSGDIDFYNEMNSAAIYHLTGLGMDYVRFAGLNASAYYSGWGAGGSIDLFPGSREGFSASLGYDYFTFRKELRDLNNLPMASVAEHAATVFAGYTGTAGGVAWGASAEGSLRQRTGTEHIFGDPANNVYPEIGRTKQYQANTLTGTLSGFVGSLPQARVVWWVRPSAGYTGFTAEYAVAGRQMEFSRWQAAVDGAVMRGWKRWMVSSRAGLARSGCMGGSLSLPGAAPGSRLDAVEANYRYLTDDFTRLHLSLEASLRAGADWSVSLRGGWTREWFRECGVANRLSAVLGFAF